MEYKEGTYCPFYGAYGKIYSLSDINGNVFYIGCTVLPLEKRLSQHVSEAKANRKGTNQTKNKIISDSGFEITATILEIKYVTARKAITAQKSLCNVEKQWIEKYIALGYDLCNRDHKRRKETTNVKEHVGQSFRISKDKIIIEETEPARA
jgi:hypothetical protein